MSVYSPPSFFEGRNTIMNKDVALLLALWYIFREQQSKLAWRGFVPSWTTVALCRLSDERQPGLQKLNIRQVWSGIQTIIHRFVGALAGWQSERYSGPHRFKDRQGWSQLQCFLTAQFCPLPRFTSPSYAPGLNVQVVELCLHSPNTASLPARILLPHPPMNMQPCYTN